MTLFINKFQPVFFKDFEACEELIESVKTIMRVDTINILLIGNSGSGKTIFLNALLREYYETVNINTDNILHINSLKEQGVQYYRGEVKTFCQTKCSVSNKKKFLVLDDIDLIPEQSQQIFRNCIDKYSHNVHFVSSCTQIQKVIESLQSRLILMRINNLTKVHLLKILTHVKETEGITIDEAAQEYILNISNTSVKILINYLEKCKLLDQHITLELATSLCTDIPYSLFEMYTTYVLEEKLIDAINILYEIHDKGYSVIDILDNYFAFVKITSMIDETIKYKIIPIICKYITIFNNIHEDEIELSLFTNNLIKDINNKK